jgi:hypothetical protein
MWRIAVSTASPPRRVNGIHGAHKQEQAMSTETFYSSSNGDRWQLVNDEQSGQMLVRHEPNLASGGRASDVAVAEFLSRSGTSPQAIALQELLD